MSEARRHPDLFTAEEAAEYLRLPSALAFNRLRSSHKVMGHRSGRTWMYAREQLDYLRRAMFGLEEPREQRRMLKIG